MDYKKILRHHLATLAFRTNFAIKGAGNNYSSFSPGNGVRTAKEILFHMTQMIKYSENVLLDVPFIKVDINDWDKICSEFYLSLKKLDATIEKLDTIEDDVILKLYQGPLSDCMTHVGQLMTLRRLSKNPVEGINFYREERIKIGYFNY